MPPHFLISSMPKPSWDALVRARPEAEPAILYIRRIIGDRAVREGHPFATLATTSLQGGPSEVERIFAYLRILEGVPGRDDLVCDLGKRQVEDYRSGEMTIRLAASWRAAGIDVGFIPRSRRSGEKTPDLRVQFSDRWAEVECVSVNENSEEVSLMEFLHFAANWVERAPGRLSGEFLPDATVEDLVWARAALTELEQSVVVQERVLEGKVRLRFEPGAERDYFPFQSLPATRCNDLTRVLDRIGKKQRQFRRDTPNMLVIEVGDLFRTFHPALIKHALEQRVQAFPRVSAVLIMQTDFLPCDHAPAVACGGFVGPTPEGFLRWGLLVWNQRARLPFEFGEVPGILAVAFKQSSGTDVCPPSLSGDLGAVGGAVAAKVKESLNRVDGKDSM